jgi:hypothetical protein
MLFLETFHNLKSILYFLFYVGVEFITSYAEIITQSISSRGKVFNQSMLPLWKAKNLNLVNDLNSNCLMVPKLIKSDVKLRVQISHTHTVMYVFKKTNYFMNDLINRNYQKVQSYISNSICILIIIKMKSMELKQTFNFQFRTIVNT